MRARVLYIHDCPNHALAVSRLQEAAGRLHVHLVVDQHRIGTADEAAQLGFGGSPSIHLDGVDLFPVTAVADLACRVYRTPDGMQGAPCVDQLVDALTPHVEPAPQKRLRAWDDGG